MTRRCWSCWTARKSGKGMVQVYVAEMPLREKETNEQSEWAHRLLDKALERQFPEICGPALLERTPKGKPFLLEHPEIHINLSHSGRYAACAVGRRPVGVDIECWKKRRRQELVVKKFHAKEREVYFRTAEEVKRARLFHDLWVLKESFMKAEGSGLLIPLDSFYMEGIRRGNGRVIQHQNDKEYYYRLYQVKEKGFSLAACSEEPDFCEEPIWVSF